MNVNYTVVMYGVYSAVSIALTIWVAHTLHKNGRVFLVDVFHGNETLADSVNHLLVVGFYLINLGYIAMMLRLGYDLKDARTSIEVLSTKLGYVLLILGFMHLLNVFVFNRMRRNAILDNAPPPVEPDACLAPAGRGGVSHAQADGAVRSRLHALPRGPALAGAAEEIRALGVRGGRHDGGPETVPGSGAGIDFAGDYGGGRRPACLPGRESLADVPLGSARLPDERAALEPAGPAALCSQVRGLGLPPSEGPCLS
jgi:hypothetical protein